MSSLCYSPLKVNKLCFVGADLYTMYTMQDTISTSDGNYMTKAFDAQIISFSSVAQPLLVEFSFYDQFIGLFKMLPLHA